MWLSVVLGFGLIFNVCVTFDVAELASVFTSYLIVLLILIYVLTSTLACGSVMLGVGRSWHVWLGNSTPHLPTWFPAGLVKVTTEQPYKHALQGSDGDSSEMLVTIYMTTHVTTQKTTISLPIIIQGLTELFRFTEFLKNVTQELLHFTVYPLELFKQS